MNSKRTGALMLAAASFIWGTSFVAQDLGSNTLDAFTFTSLRSFIAAVVLFFVSFIKDRFSAKKPEAASDIQNKGNKKTLFWGGLFCAIASTAAAILQQTGIEHTTVGKAGFITTFYIILVPVFGIFLGRKLRAPLWISILAATTGLYFLCVTEKLTVSAGDIYVLLCAVFFAIHILVIDRFSPLLDPIKLSCVQFFICGLLTLIPAVIWGDPDLKGIISAIPYLLYCGVLSNSIAYTLQIAGQKRLDPSFASLLMCLESVFSVLAGWVVLKQSLSLRELAGCALVFAAVISAQFFEKLSAHNDKNKAGS